MAGAGVCTTISTELWLHRKEIQMELEPLASLRNPGVFCFPFFPLSALEMVKHLGQRIPKPPLLVKLLTCFSVKTMHNLIVLIS